MPEPPRRSRKRAKPTYISGGGPKDPPHTTPPTPEGYDKWVALAERRIISVLQSRIAANIRQLEVKISESGPGNIRPEPHILSDALRSLSDRGQIRTSKPKGVERREETRFYSLAKNDPELVRGRIKELLVPYRTHRMLADTEEYCSRVLEDIVRLCFDASSGYTYLGRLPKSSPLDGVYELKAQKIGVEVKNVREWIYPTSGEVWIMVRKCLQINAIPFLVTRKTSYIARNFLDELGIMHFQVWRQVFSKDVAHLLPDIQHTDRLGYKDVVAVDIIPNPHLVAHLQDTLPGQIAGYRAQWDRRQDVLHEFAITRGLGNSDMKDQERKSHYEDLRSSLFHIEYQDTYDDYPDREPEDPV